MRTVEFKVSAPPFRWDEAGGNSNWQEPRYS